MAEVQGDQTLVFLTAVEQVRPDHDVGQTIRVHVAGGSDRSSTMGKVLTPEIQKEERLIEAAEERSTFLRMRVGVLGGTEEYPRDTVSAQVTATGEREAEMRALLAGFDAPKRVRVQ